MEVRVYRNSVLMRLIQSFKYVMHGVLSPKPLVFYLLTFTTQIISLLSLCLLMSLLKCIQKMQVL